MVRHFLLLLFVTFSQTSFASSQIFHNLFNATEISRENYRKATYNEKLLKQKLAKQNEDDLIFQIEAEHKQVALYDKDYSEKINDLINFVKQHPTYISKLLHTFYIEEHKFRVFFEKNESCEKLIKISGRLSIISYVLQEYYSNEILSSNRHISNHITFEFRRLKLVKTAEYFSRNEEERALLVEEIGRLRTSISDMTDLLNPDALQSYELISTNSVVHQILTLSGKCPSTYDYSNVAEDFLFKDEPKDSPISLAVEIILQQSKILQNLEHKTASYTYKEVPALDTTFYRERTKYIQIDNLDFLDAVYLPMEALDNILSETSRLVEFMYDGLYEHKISENLSTHTLDHVIFLKKHKPVKDIEVPFGPWDISISNDYYVRIQNDPKSQKAKKESSDTYDAMQKGFEVGIYDFVKGARIFLSNGGNDPQLDSAKFNQARLTYAKFFSEPARNFKTWVINLMILDLIEIGVIKNIDEFFELHPMRGGSFAHQSSEGENKNKDQITRDETRIFANWLKQFWPKTEPVTFTNEIGPDYFKDAQKKSAAEEYYYGLMIQMLFHRFKGTSLFTTQDFTTGDIFLTAFSQFPPRLLGVYLPTGILKLVHGDPSKCNELIPLYNEHARMSDLFSIRIEAETFLKEITKNSDPKLKGFFEKKLTELEENEFSTLRADYNKVLSNLHRIQRSSIYLEEEAKQKNLSAEESYQNFKDSLAKKIQESTFLASHNGLTHTFRERVASPMGNNCAFEVLGVTRGLAIEQLLNNAHQAHIRTLVADDIEASLMGDELPESMRSFETEGLHARYTLYTHLVNIDVHHGVNDATNVQHLNEILVQLRAYASNESTFTNFVRSYLQDQPGMLSYVRDHHGLLDAVAELNGLEVNVWTQQNEEENMLTQIHHYTPTGEIQRTVNMHHTWDMTHFNHLHDTTEEDRFEERREYLTQIYYFMLFRVLISLNHSK